ncbi:MAG TPA: hypothetical protein VFW11_10050 [Cyclobacteriaceae bacterium]|nr:hypothetical protein [Cyclobacteriaceae bacterium]
MRMTESLQKLIFIGCCVLAVTSFMTVKGSAQIIQANNESEYRIQSKDDYIKAERLVDTLAEQLYALYQSYPALTIQHHFNTQNELVNVTVEGIDDPLVADKAALCYMKLEKLAIAVRDADPAFIPQRAEVGESEVLNEKQSEEFIPKKDKADNKH